MLRSDDFTRIHASAADAIAGAQYRVARSQLVQMLDLPLSYLQYTKTKNLIKRLELTPSSTSGKKIRLALLASSTTDHLRDVLLTSAKVRGLDLVLYESPFDSIEQEVLNPQSGLYAFGPSHVLFLP